MQAMTVFRNAWVKLSTNTNCLFGYISQTSSFHQVWRVRLRVNAMLFLSLYFALISRLREVYMSPVRAEDC